MKVLYLADASRDAAAFLLYLGLAREIGADGVDLLLWSKPYVSGDSKAGTYPWMSAAVVSLGRTTEVIKEPWAPGYDVVVVVLSPDTVKALDEVVIAKNGRWAVKKLVLVDTGDAELRLDLAERLLPDAYLKVMPAAGGLLKGSEVLGEKLALVSRVIAGIHDAKAEDLPRVMVHARSRAHQLLAAVDLAGSKT